MGDSGMMEEPKQEDRDSQRNEQQGVSNLLIGVAIAGAVLLVIGLWLYVGPSTPTQKKDFVQAVGVLLAGFVGLIGLLLTWRNQRLTQRSLEDTRRNTEEQLRLTEQGQMTERFTRAIDQLGATDDDRNPRLEIRLGGIYALERIDKESPKRAYHPTVMEVLTAYVRENAPWPAKASKLTEDSFIKPPEDGSASDSASNAATEQDKDTVEEEEPTVRRPRADIQAILDVLNRREEDDVPEQNRVRLDLHVANLQGSNLQEANLQGADLQGANVREAFLQGAVLVEANLRRVFLQGSNLQGADLKYANLMEALLHQAVLQRAFLQGSNLQGALLHEAVDLTQAQIEDAVGDKDTRLPERLHPPAMWSKDTEEQRRILQERFSGSE
jgi:hypothetical protein